MQRRGSLLILAAMFVTPMSSLHAAEKAAPKFDALRGTIWDEAAATAGLCDPLLVYAIALIESGADDGQGGIAPYPWTLGYAGRDVRTSSRRDAEVALSRIGPDSNIDIGLMQINWAAHHGRVRCPSDMLAPAANVRLGAQLLGESLTSSPDDMVLGLGRYHSWNETRARWYGTAVWRLYLSLLTPPATRRERLA